MPAVTGVGWAALQYIGVAWAGDGEAAGLGVGFCWQAGAMGTRAKPELPPWRVRQFGAVEVLTGIGVAEAVPPPPAGSPRLAMTCRCCSWLPLCWAASCS